jgi:hypothetical protein
VKTSAAVAELVREDVAKLREAGLKETRGDVRCIIYGHMIRLAVWSLRHSWDKKRPVREKTAAVVAKINEFGGLAEVEKHFGEDMMQAALVRTSVVREKSGRDGADDEISFNSTNLERTFGRGFAQMHADFQELESKSQVTFLANAKS